KGAAPSPSLSAPRVPEVVGFGLDHARDLLPVLEAPLTRGSLSCSSDNRARSRSKVRRSSGRWHSRSRRSGHRNINWRPNNRARRRSRSRSPIRSTSNNWPLSEQEKQRQVEERRVIYVGRIEEGTTKAELRRRFEAFGPIIDISVHFREHGDNYGFVTFAYKMDAYDAVEHGNDNPNLPKYDLCFGGRRAFCKTRYADLDGMATSSEPRSHGSSAVWVSRSRPQTENSFDLLLREAKAKIKKLELNTTSTLANYATKANSPKKNCDVFRMHLRC
ncbi:unnamed protein product, partial [Timema podura]|nr:unnamed protein product [Timema podura]